MKKYMAAFICLVCMANYMYAQNAIPKKKLKVRKYVTSVDFLFGYELPAQNYISTLQNNSFSQLPMPAPSFALQFTGRMGPAFGFVAQLYHSYYPFEHDYKDYASNKNFLQYGLYMGPSIRLGTTKFLLEISGLAGFTLVENQHFMLTASPLYNDVQPNDQVVFTARGMVDFRYQLHKRLAFKIGTAFTYAEYDIKVDNSLITFYNDRITPMFGIVILSK